MRFCLFILCLEVTGALYGQKTKYFDAATSNSLSMQLLRIEPGEFIMGNDSEIDYANLLKDEPHTPYLPKGAANPYITGGPVMQENPLEWDEKPSHKVILSKAYYMSSTPVTNAQYEQFRPEHRFLRGKSGYSKNDSDAVVFVSWDDAVAFCEWLSKKEGVTYRLPTEAEWEYAARAGTVSAYSTGDSLPQAYWQHQVMNRSHSFLPEKVNLAVAKVPANQWGLYNMHGLVEEWCADWYGYYRPGEQKDPTGAARGSARVTRGGSHSTGLPFLRSANRSAALPATRSFTIGFRVVCAEKPVTNPSTDLLQAKWALDVKQQRFNWKRNKVSATHPVFEEPKTFTRVPPGSNGPFYFIHNHQPALSVLPNGDLLAIWFTTTLERGREMVVAGSRLRRGAKQWDEPGLFFHIPDRNLTGQTLWWDGDSTVFHFSGVSVADDWKRLSMSMRKSTDNGVKWTEPVIIGPEYGVRHQAIDAMIKTTDGRLVFLCDVESEGIPGSAAHISTDGGQSWHDPGKNQPYTRFEAGNTGSSIAGIHAGIVELKDGSWLALGRSSDINGKMPMSISNDKGKTWQYSASPFNPITHAQRLSLIRLNEGPLLLISFEEKMTESLSNGKKIRGIGMYAALSYDEGKTWPLKKFITPGTGSRILDAPCNRRWGAEYSLLDATHAERRGYTTAEQAPDGMIHVLSSGTHYAFNLAWISRP